MWNIFSVEGLFSNVSHHFFIRGEKLLAYTALYRKFRPKIFSEIVGQEHITQTLKNQIISGRVGHAYLFNGGRGTGKTSAAKVLARAINCLNPKDGEPCNECEVCKGILAGSLTDVVEMDAASNNSVEDIRSIRDEVNFLPTVCKYRVYIIDEVHMLSSGAFNALLKTLEEPPEHVKFILATTEPQKLPATILSRCQRFDFKRIANNYIIQRLQVVCQEAGIEITEEALKVIAVLSEGGMRDALSILERCLQDGETKINEEKVKDLVGIPKLTYVHQIVESILHNQVEQTLQTTQEVLNQGKDLNNLLWEMIKYVKDILVYQTSASIEIYNENEKKQMEELGKLASKEGLLALIYALSELENEIKWSTQKTIMFQAGMIKLCSKKQNQGIEELEKRVTKLENEIAKGITLKSKLEPNTNSMPREKIERPANKPVASSNKTSTSPNYANAGLEAKGYWPEIVEQFKKDGKIMLYTNLIHTQAKEINDMTVGIEFPNGLTAFGRTVLEKLENKKEIEKQISIASGKPMQVKYIDMKANTTSNGKEEKNNGIADIAKGLDIPINIIE